jgi:serine/threonine protein kinase/WD40 repeat protein
MPETIDLSPEGGDSLKWGPVLRFDLAWRQGARPRVEDYLPPDGAGHLDVLLELVHTDLERRIKAGEPARIEEYLSSFPRLRDCTTAVLDLIANEFEQRRRREAELTPEEYHRRFPELHAELALRLPAAGPSPDRFSLPGYEILGVIGKGGMGVVCKARQLSLDRLVAIKFLRDGALADAEQRERFYREARASASLHHPHLIQVLDYGQSGGVAYLVMEYVDGPDLAQVLSGGPLPEAEAASLVEKLARAIHHAHTRHVLHRDLKPANVLLQQGGNHRGTEGTERPEDKSYSSGCSVPSVPLWFHDSSPKITDFGLAKRLDESGQTRTGQMLGTPLYMAPEQAKGQKVVGPACDVYGLGAILYEALAGAPPFQGEPGEVLARVAHEEPLPPSRRRAGVSRDLETICLKCLEKEPARRYASAEDLADDLGRWRRGEPIRARRTRLAGRLWCWCRRKPALAAAWSLLSMILLTLLSLWLLELRKGRGKDALRGRELAEVQEQEKESSRKEALRGMEDALAQAGKSEPGRALLWYVRALELAQSANALHEETPTRLSMALCRTLLSPLRDIRDDPDQGLAFDPAPRSTARQAPWNPSTRRAEVLIDQQGKPPRKLPLGNVEVLSLAISPDGRTIAAGLPSANVGLWDADSGNPSLYQWVAPRRLDRRHRLPNPSHQDLVRAVAFSPDGQLLLTGSDDKTARLWRWHASKAHAVGAPLQHGAPVKAVSFSRDGRGILTTDKHGKRRLWQVSAIRPPLLHNHHVVALAYAPDGKTIVTNSSDGYTRFWDERRPLSPVICIPHPEADDPKRLTAAEGIAFSSDGKRFATGSGQFAGKPGKVRMWKQGTQHPQWEVLHPGGGVQQVAFSRDDRSLFAGTYDGKVYCLDVETGTPIGPPLDQGSSVGPMALTPDGKFLITRRDNSACIWKLAKGGFAGLDQQLAHDHVVSAVDCTRDGTTILTATAGGVVQLWDARTREPLPVRLKHSGPVWTACFSPDGKMILTSSGKLHHPGVARLWDVATGRPIGPAIDHPDTMYAVTFSPDGKTFLTGCLDWTVRSWPTPTLPAQSLPCLAISAEVITGTRLDPDGELEVLGESAWRRRRQALEAMGEPPPG